MREMAHTVFETGAVSAFQAPNQFSRNYVNLKTKKNVLKGLPQNIQSPGLGQSYQIFATADYKSVMLDRKDNLENLNRQFPGLVELKVLFTMRSEFHHTLLQVYFIKVDIELVRLGILVDG